MSNPSLSSQHSAFVGPSPRRLVLVRHGETDEAARGRFVGRTDLPLSASGRTAAMRLADTLVSLFPARVFVSPLRRAQETARLALRPHCDAIETEDWLREIDFGRWDGETFDTVEARDPELVRTWVRNEAEFHFPDGESVAGFCARVTAGATRLLKAWESNASSASTVILFSHAGVIRVLLCHLLGIPAERHRVFQVQHATVSIVELREGVGILTQLNHGPSLSTEALVTQASPEPPDRHGALIESP